MSAFTADEQKHLTQAAYSQFLRDKIKLAQRKGFDVPLEQIHPNLKPHTRDIVRWALAGGQRAIFASFGLHKTSTNLEVMRQIGIHRPGGIRGIVAPLGVRQEFSREVAKRFTGDQAVDLRFIRSDAEIDDERTIYMTNYESVREGKIDVTKWQASGLDEASVLRSYGSKTYQEFLPMFEGVEFKFVYTATPSPNRFKELIHYAGYLGVMDTGQALTRFFQRDSEKAGNLTLYPHKEHEFWLWVASWAVFIQRPSDLGHSDEGYNLPALDVRFHEVASNYDTAGAEKNGQGLLIPNVAMGLSAAAGEKRDSMAARVAKVAEIMAEDPDDHFLIWHDLEDERHALQAALPDVVSVWGTQDLEQREQRIADFSDGKIKDLSTKPIIAGSGCNFQVHCHREIFAGIGFKFNDFIQAVHRVQRFQQPHPVRIDIIHTEVERKVLADLMEKWRRHDEMQAKMGEIIRTYGLDQLSMQDSLARTIGVTRQEEKGERFTVANNDCVLEAMRQPDNSVGLIVTSVPFGNQYEYSPSYNDFGHTQDNAHFWAQMDFLTPELLRILQPGRIYACHVKDRINFGNVTGAGIPTVSPFHAEAIFHGIKHGFDYCGMIQVNTDVVRENNQTYRLGYSEVCKDGTKMSVGMPEYILLFHKPQTDRSRGYADVPVTKVKPLCLADDGAAVPFDRKLAPIPCTGYSVARWQVDAHAFWRSSGDRLIGSAELASFGPAKLAKMFTDLSLVNVYNYEYHVAVGEALLANKALPADYLSLAPGSTNPMVWHDVLRMNTLNKDQSSRAVEKHVCPFQIDIVDRLINRYSNPGEVVYDPFCGLGTVPVRAMKLGRRGAGSELNSAYFADQVHYCQAMEREVSMPTLFDFEAMDAEQEH
jgi:DNA modification methylase